MNFLNPLAFIGLISIPAIIVMYLLKQKYKNQVVPSLFLWKQAVTMSLSERPWQKLRRNLLMLLQILLALLLVFALANPFALGSDFVASYVIIIDTSASMQATDSAPTRFENAKSLVYQLIDDAKNGTEFSVIAASGNPFLLSGYTDDKLSVKNKIENLSVSNGGIDLAATAELVKMVQSGKETTVFSFSDSMLEFAGVEKQDFIVGKNSDNVAITLLSHVVDSDRIVTLVKVKNFGESRAVNTVSLYTDDIIFDVAEITLEAGQEKDVFFPSVPLGSKLLTAKLTNSDVLPIDDVAYDVVSDSDKKRTLLVTDKNIFLENMLSLMPNLELYKGTPESFETSGYELYVYDGFLPEVLPTDGHVLIFNPPVGNSFIQTNDEVLVSNLFQSESSLLKYVSGINFSILKSKELVLPDWASVVVSSTETPLIISGEINSQKIAVMGFDLHNTDLPLKKEYPIFMYNLMQYFVPDTAFSANALSGDAVSVSLNPSTEKALVVSPSGKTTNFTNIASTLVFNETNEVGFYVLEQTTNEGKKYDSFPVNVVKTESDLKRTGEAENVGTVKTVKGTAANKNLKNYFIAAILAVLCLEWWVFSRVN